MGMLTAATEELTSILRGATAERVGKSASKSVVRGSRNDGAWSEFLGSGRGSTSFPDGSHSMNAIPIDGQELSIFRSTSTPINGKKITGFRKEARDTKMPRPSPKDNNFNMFDLFNSAKGKAPSIGGGALIGGGFALGGSMIYGAGRMMSPGNTEVDNPLKNVAKGAFVGGVAAAAMLASHNASTAGNMTKAFKNSASPWIRGLGEHMPGVQNAMNSTVAKGAIGAALVAGSGQFDMTRPVNPIF